MIDMAETDSAINQFGVPENAHTPRGKSPLLAADVCHPARLSNA